MVKPAFHSDIAIQASGEEHAGDSFGRCRAAGGFSATVFLMLLLGSKI
jgi:hypothetical protein